MITQSYMEAACHHAQQGAAQGGVSGLARQDTELPVPARETPARMAIRNNYRLQRKLTPAQPGGGVFLNDFAVVT